MAEPDRPRPHAATAKRLTLLDVARALGVSRTTVSNAFNRPEALSRTRREAVLDKARELAYFGPDPAARAMRRSGVREVAVIFHHDLRYALSDPQSMDFMRGVAGELDRRRLTLQLIPRMGRRLDLGAAFQTTADALIVHAEVDPELAHAVRATHKPLVLVDSQVPGQVSVRSQDRQGAAQAMAHALAARPDRVLALTFPLDPAARAAALGSADPPTSACVSGERIAGCAAAARQAGFPMERIVWLDVDGEPESAAEVVAAAATSLAADCRVAIVAMSDRMALAAQAVARRWQGPRLVALVGFDDIAAAAAAGLTTVRQDSRRKGECAVQALLDGATPWPLPVQLIVRAT